MGMLNNERLHPTINLGGLWSFYYETTQKFSNVSRFLPDLNKLSRKINIVSDLKEKKKIRAVLYELLQLKSCPVPKSPIKDKEINSSVAYKEMPP